VFGGGGVMSGHRPKLWPCGQNVASVVESLPLILGPVARAHSGRRVYV